MSSLLIASYSIRLKKLYDSVKDDISEILSNRVLDNREKVFKFSLPIAKKAFKIGVDFASIYGPTIGFDVRSKNKYEINAKTKNKLYKTFIDNLRDAEAIFQFRQKQNKKALQRDGIKRNVTKSGTSKNFSEYKLAVRFAVNNLILNAGSMGQESMYIR